MDKIVKIILVVLVCVSLGFLSGLVTENSVNTWYPTLVKPFFNPPNWIFAPVWTLLYIMMAIAAGLVWTSNGEDKAVKKALSFFIIQFALNMLWSYIFFGLRNPFLALIEIALLWLLIWETYVQFKKINKTAGYLFIPYIAWVSFAMLLNAGIWWLNR